MIGILRLTSIQTIQITMYKLIEINRFLHDI